MAFYAIHMEPGVIPSTAEMAIQAFEKLNDLTVVVHDLTAQLWPFLLPERFRHCSARCLAVKATRDWACQDFEIHRLRPAVVQFPDGRYHICHAGIFEWMVPVFIENRLAWILFAGQRQLKGVYRHLTRDIRTTTRAFTARNAPPSVTEEQAVHVLEALRQLRARLLQWHTDAARRQPEGELLAGRRLLIERYIFDHHAGAASVAGLAQQLQLSESRAIHLVKEIFGRSYIKLLSEMRLRTAASLLRETAMPILDVCLASGFQDLSHFHRFFRRRFGVTPLRYRRLPPA